MNKIIIYDCEIIKCLPSLQKKLEPNFMYCQGWNDFCNMGISVIAFQVLEDLQDVNNRFYYFTNPNNLIPYTFEKLNDFLDSTFFVIGFNTKKFDDKLMRANGMKIKTNYDLLEEIRRAGYGSPQWKHQPKHWNYTLEAIARANGMSKTGSGDLAPQLWQQGKHQMVVDYCLNDVKLTNQILKLGLSGQLIDPNTGKYLTLKTLF
ncbi:hypothetical protein [Gloeothece citriformis]|uniref:hypothetical protein n=1 Tax=Gloeothece citriformis TaxID=2546356 RepID=UPI000173CED6|nr:hypothetical protein [Gloeothece citriformis]